MRNSLVGILALGTVASLTSHASAKTLNAGAGQPYTSACAALVDAKENDEIDVAPGTYTDSCTITVAGLTIKGVGRQPKLDLSGTDHPSGDKAILVVHADNVRLENLELTGAHIPVDTTYGGNGAGAGNPSGGAQATGGAGGGAANAGGSANVGGTSSASGATGNAGGASNSGGAGGASSSKDSGGCSCSQAGSRGDIGAAWSGLAAVLALLSRGRRRPRLA